MSVVCGVCLKAVMPYHNYCWNCGTDLFSTMQESEKIPADLPEAERADSERSSYTLLADVRALPQYDLQEGSGNQFNIVSAEYKAGNGNYVNIDKVIKLISEHFR